MCPHGDPTCPCPDGDPCHYEGGDANLCPNPALGIEGLSNPHCHMEGCDWHVKGCSPDMPIDGACGLLKRELLPPVGVFEGKPYWSSTQATPGLIGWGCGWLRTPLNVSSGAQLGRADG
jgi:hypothetical protein